MVSGPYKPDRPKRVAPGAPSYNTVLKKQNHSVDQKELRQQFTSALARAEKLLDAKPENARLEKRNKISGSSVTELRDSPATNPSSIWLATGHNDSAPLNQLSEAGQMDKHRRLAKQGNTATSSSANCADPAKYQAGQNATQASRPLVQSQPMVSPDTLHNPLSQHTTKTMRTKKPEGAAEKSEQNSLDLIALAADALLSQEANCLISTSLNTSGKFIKENRLRQGEPDEQTAAAGMLVSGMVAPSSAAQAAQTIEASGMQSGVSSTALESYATVESMWRHLATLVTSCSPQEWRFQIGQPGAVVVSVAMSPGSEGGWRVTVGSVVEGAAVAQACLAELRDKFAQSEIAVELLCLKTEKVS